MNPTAVRELYDELGREPSAPRPVRRFLFAGLALFVGLIGGACLSTALPGELLATARAVPAAGPGSVPVRLGHVEGRFGLDVELGSGRSMKLVREGDGVLALEADGSSKRDRWLRIEPAGEANHLEFDGRRYQGSLLVEARPEGGLRATLWSDLEDYVRGVIAAEVSLWNANPAEVGAQAVAARSFARATLEQRALNGSRPFLWDDERDQVFRGRFQPSAAERSRGLERLLDEAIDATRGQVLAIAGQITLAGFHASCGGRTSMRSEVFGGTDGASRQAVCEPCLGRGPLPQESAPTWSYTASTERLAEVARRFRIGERLVSLRPTSTDAGSRWLSVELEGDRGTTVRRFQDLRQVLGFSLLPSGVISRAWPAPGAPLEGGMYFEGRGRGHGIGLCQHGAHGYGQRGWTTGQILEHYYSSARVVVR